MSKEIVSADEMSFLLNKNRELVMQELLDEDALATVHFAIQKGLMALNETLENVTKKELNTLMVDYQLQSGEDVLTSKLIESVVLFNYKVSHNNGNHLILMQQKELQQLYAYLQDTEVEEELSELQIEWLFKQMTLSLKNYYKRFTEDLNCHIHLEASHISKLNLSKDQLVDIQLEELYESKTYEVQFNNKRAHILHLSNLDFLEYAYENLEKDDEEEFTLEDLYQDTNEEYLEMNSNDVKDSVYSTPTNQTKQIKKPQFAAFNDDAYDEGKHNLGLLYDVPLELSVVLGKTKRSVKEVLEINTGKIIELNKYADDPLEIYVNGKLIAEGEVVVVDENFGVRVTKLFNNELNFKANKR